MRSIFRYAGAALLSLALAGCNGVGLGGENTSVSPGGSAVEHWDYSDKVNGEPLPECIPFDAPTDYLGVDPADADPYDAFFFIAHKRANSINMSMSRGTAVAEVASFATYEQKLAGLTMNSGTTYFNIFCATGSFTIGSFDGITAVNKGARAFEDVSKGIYVGQETNDNSTITIDLDAPEGEYPAEVVNWGTTQNVSDRQELFDRFGHDLFSTTSYYVPDSSAILSATVRPDGDNYVFTFNFSLTDDGTLTNAARYYTDTLNDGISSGSLTFEITELAWSATVNTDWEIITTESTERYTISVLNLQVSCVNNTTADFFYYDSVEDIDNKSAIEEWNDAVDAMDIVASVDKI